MCQKQHAMRFSLSVGRRRGLLLNTWCIQRAATWRGGDFDPRILHKDNVMAACQPEVVEGNGSTINAYASRDIPCARHAAHNSTHNSEAIGGDSAMANAASVIIKCAPGE